MEPARRGSTVRILSTTHRQHAFCLLDDVCLMAHWDRPFQDDDFEEYIELMKREARARPPARALNFSPNHAPGLKQRQRIKELTGAVPVPAGMRNALISNSGLVRGAVTAISWFTKNMSLRSFAVDRYREALDWLVEGHALSLHSPVVLAAFEELTAYVGYPPLTTGSAKESSLRAADC